ncbi:MAG: hypothetical protein WDZ59_02835 [Pirellulales bacterium]
MHCDLPAPGHRSAAEAQKHGPLVRFDSAAFERFDRKMDHSLGRLVARWLHAAAPNANRGVKLR